MPARAISSRTLRVAVVLATVLALIPVPISVSAAGGTTVTVDATQVSGSLAPDYVGLSYETATLASGGFDSGTGNEATIMQTLGVRNLRIGGNTVDRGVVPTNADLTRLASFLNAIDGKVELAVGIFPTANSAQISSETQSAMSILGPRLDSIQCGNEPNDIFGTYAAFIAQYDTCKAAIAGRVPISGPDTCCGTTTWQAPFVSANTDVLDMVTNHFYNNSANVTALLAPASDAAEISFPGVVNALTAAKSHGFRYRSDETNSHNGGGLRGVSDVYASALWSMDYSLLMATQGVDGLNFHGFFETCGASVYSPLCAPSSAAAGARVMTFAPMSYGLWMASHLGAGQLHPVTVSGGNNVTAYALTAADGTVHIAVIEKDPTGGSVPVTVSVTGAAAAGSASVLEMTGGSLTSPGGIAIQGASVDSAGRLSPGAPTMVPVSAGSLSLSLPTGSAALITVPRSGACVPRASAPPTGASASASGGAQALVSWSAPADTGCGTITAYAVYYYSTASFGITETVTSSATISGLVPGNYYTFTVTAWNGTAWSGWSGWASYVLVT